MKNNNIGYKLHNFAKKLWPYNRSLTGNGVRKTLDAIKEINSILKVYSVPTGTKVFDWKIPNEWNVKDAYIISPRGKKICEFKKNNLHLVGYSVPIKKKLNLESLQKHLHSLPKKPNAIPYVTSYYKKYWGFCITQKQRDLLKRGNYIVNVETELKKGFLNYGEILVKGKSKKEIFLSTYICHPSMANNELSGISVLSYIANWLISRKNYYTYRIIFIPETIGSITYLSRNLRKLKSRVFAGYNLTCIGDNRTYSYLPTRNGATISDQVAKHVLKNIYPSFKTYKWADRGSDERQYCSPGVDLPIASLMRSKYSSYSEYHTSKDDLKKVVTPAGLEGGYNLVKLVIESLETNFYPKIKILCEPHMSKRNLYPTLSNNNLNTEIKLTMDIISYSDGSKSLIEIAENCEVPVWKIYEIIKKLKKNKLVKISRKQF